MNGSEKFYHQLDYFYKNKDFQGAFEYMLNKQREADEANDLELIIIVSNELGAMYRVRGKTDLALKEYERVFEILDRLGMQNTKNYANALVNLGNVYTVMGEYERSHQCGVKAVRILETYPDSRYEIATLNNNLCIVLRELGRMDEAEALARQAIEIISAIDGCEIERATSYVNLGQTEAKEGKLTCARKTLNFANSIFEKAGFTNDFHYIVSVHTLAEIDELEGKLHTALDGYKRARFLYEKNFGKNPYFELISKCVERIEIKLNE